MRTFAPKFARRTRGLLNSKTNCDLERERRAFTIHWSCAIVCRLHHTDCKVVADLSWSMEGLRTTFFIKVSTDNVGGHASERANRGRPPRYPAQG